VDGTFVLEVAKPTFNNSLTIPHHPPLFAANKHMTENQLIRKMKPKTTHCFLPLCNKASACQPSEKSEKSVVF